MDGEETPYLSSIKRRSLVYSIVLPLSVTHPKPTVLVRITGGGHRGYTRTLIILSFMIRKHERAWADSNN